MRSFGLLTHIRETSPRKSSWRTRISDLSLEYQPFFRDADAVLHKTKMDYVEFKRTVDRLLDTRLSLGFYLDRVSRELGEHAATAPKAVDKARTAILTAGSMACEGILIIRIEERAGVGPRH